MPVYKSIAPLAFMSDGGQLTIKADNLQYVQDPQCQIGANLVPSSFDGRNTITCQINPGPILSPPRLSIYLNFNERIQ